MAGDKTFEVYRKDKDSLLAKGVEHEDGSCEIEVVDGQGGVIRDAPFPSVEVALATLKTMSSTGVELKGT